MASATAVLVVEDNPLVRADAAELFQNLGASVLEAYRAEQALDVLAEHPEIDLVFCDVHLPGRDGVTLAGVIRDRHPGVRVVLTSGYGVPRGELEFVPKPWRERDLARLLGPYAPRV
jgi:CheY-like chemotaxis protein